jgi:hypothetical protein
LRNEGITAEDTLIPTLVFAKIAGGTPEYTALVGENASISGLEIAELMQAADNWPPRHGETAAEYAKTLTDYVQEHGYGGWQLVRVVRGVPILRVQPVVALPETHPGTEILKSVRVQVLSRHVKPSEVEKTYEQLLVDNGVRWGANNSGQISYQFHDGFLQVEAGLEGTISPPTAKSVGANTLCVASQLDRLLRAARADTNHEQHAPADDPDHFSGEALALITVEVRELAYAP